jgi:BolA protein
MTPEQRPAAIRDKLMSVFAPSEIDVIDDSHKHAGHASAGGAGHFTVHLVSDVFSGKNTVERHRMVYAALAEFMPEHIHALSIRASAPAEQA